MVSQATSEHSPSSARNSAPEDLQSRQLRVQSGQDSSPGRKSSNEDSMGLWVPDDARTLIHKGVALVIADGVSSAEAGREAAETCVKSFLSDYFSTPETWTVETSVRKVLGALNGWLYRQSSRFTNVHRGLVSTLSILVIKSRTAYIFHVGDTRVYLLRRGQLEQLTHDHTTVISEKETYLARAMGLDTKIDVDFKSLSVDVGDVFLLTTDGIHDFVDTSSIIHLVNAEPELPRACLSLIQAAIAGGSTDNLTCQLLRIEQLPESSADEYISRLTSLPFPPELSPGIVLDGFRVERSLHLSRRSQLYLVKELATGRRLVMKTPSVNYEDDPAYIERFILEHWIGTRVQSRHLVRSVAPPDNRSCLYHLMEYIEGTTLAQWLQAQRSLPKQTEEVARIIGQIARGLQALHRRQIVHQDIKPDNVIIDPQGVAVIIDYGSCFVAGIEELPVPLDRERALGTVCYSAPEYSLGIKANHQADLYSLGCIAYELLTHKHPYGTAAESARSGADFARLTYTPAYHHNPHVPLWVDGALKKALALNPAERYRELSELTYDLENPNREYLEARPVVPLEDPARRWRRLALLLLLTQLFSLLYLALR